MNELINTYRCIGTLRLHFLSTVSALVLVGVVNNLSEAMATEDKAGSPTIWIELGGQFERVDGSEERFAPPFLLAAPRPLVETISPLNVERPPRYATGMQGKIAFQPSDTDWLFSASITYGRSNGKKHVHQQSRPGPVPGLGDSLKYPIAAQFADTAVKHSESHLIVDFQAGKDAGLGMLGINGSSTLSVGARFAQFGTKSNVILKTDPDFHFGSTSFHFFQFYHSNSGGASAARSFHGVGPSLSWNASAAMAGSPEEGQIAFDMGASAAVLFGRQRADTSHHASTIYNEFIRNSLRTILSQNQTATAHARARSVIVPNVGGFAGITFRRSDAKVSFGYRADFFFGAMDGGLDSVRKDNRGFYGPYASISIGLGR